MDRFIHEENLAIFKSKLEDPDISAEQRRVLLELLAEEEAKELATSRGDRGRVSRRDR